MVLDGAATWEVAFAAGDGGETALRVMEGAAGAMEALATTELNFSRGGTA